MHQMFEIQKKQKPRNTDEYSGMRPKTCNGPLRHRFAKHNFTRSKSADRMQGVPEKVKRRFVFKSHPDVENLRKNEYILTMKNCSEFCEESAEQLLTENNIDKYRLMELNFETELSFVWNVNDNMQNKELIHERRAPTPWMHSKKLSQREAERFDEYQYDVTKQYVTSSESSRVKEVMAPQCCHGPNNGALINNKDNVEDWYYEDMGIVREKTMLMTTMSPPVPSKRIKKPETTEGVGNKTQQDTVSRCNYNNSSSANLSPQRNDKDNYYQSCKSNANEGILTGVNHRSSPQDSSSAYPSSSFSGESSESEEEGGGFTEIFVLSDNLNPIFNNDFGTSSPSTEISELEHQPQSISDMEVEHINHKVPMELTRNSTEQVQQELSENRGNTDDRDIIPDGNVIYSDRNCSDPADNEGFISDDISIRGQDEKAMSRISDSSTPSQISPPSAMKKRSSLSRSGSGKKQKVQFDMDIEVHFVPRDQYGSTTASIISELSDFSGYEGTENEEDSYSEHSNDVDDDVIHPRDAYGQLDSMNRSRESYGPNVPFRLIKRDTPTGSGGRRGRRDSFDLKQVQKLMTQQARERASIGKKLGITDHERRYLRPPRPRRGPSPPRTPHSSYYPSREYRRQFDDPRVQMRANAMSPEQYVAFYTRQQQLKQYLDHERRLRRQLLLNGNIKYNEAHRKQERSMPLSNERDEDDDSESDSGTEDGHLPQVKTRNFDRLPQPKPYVRGSAHGQRKSAGQDEVSRISSGYGDSVSESESSSMTIKNEVNLKDDLSSLPLMTSNISGTVSQQPFTQRQVAEVMRASGINKANMTFYSERNRRRQPEDDTGYKYSARQRQRRVEQARELNLSEASGTFSKLSLNARKALQQAHIAYTSSLNDMMPAAKPLPDAVVGERLEDDTSRDSKLKIEMVPTISGEPRHSIGQNYLNEGSQPFVRYLHSNSRGKIPESFARQQSHVRDPLSSGRLNSGRAASLKTSSTFGNSRPGTTESITTVNMLGLSARLPLNSRRSAKSQKSQEQKQTKTNSKSPGDPYRRLTSGNKSPYLKSQLPDEFLSRNNQPSFSHNGTDSMKLRTYYNHDSANFRRRNFRHQDSDLFRSGPPQLRGNHYNYAHPGTQSANHSKGASVTKISV